MSVYRSIGKNLAANSMSMGVNFVYQIAMVPLFISYWGVHKYADWILISAFSSFFAMTDLGLNRASNNEFVIKYQRRDYAACVKLQTNAFVFVLAMFSTFILLAMGIAYFGSFRSLLGVTIFTENETSLAFILLLSEVFLTMYGRVYHGVFRATAHTHIAIVIDNLVRISTVTILFCGILLKISIVPLLIVYLIPTIFGIFYKHYQARRLHAMRISLKDFDAAVFKKILHPSFQFMLFPLGQAISNQGLVFVVSSVLGASVLVAFTTTRTLVNFMRQLMNMLSTSINPEICAAYGRKDYRLISDIYHRSLILTLLISSLSVLLLLVTGHEIYEQWTKGQVLFNRTFFVGMLIVLQMTCLWGVSSVIPLATNTHGRFTSAFIGFQTLGVLSCAALLQYYPTIEAIPIPLILSELALLVFTIKENNAFLNTNLSESISDISSQTRFLIQKGKTVIKIKR